MKHNQTLQDWIISTQVLVNEGLQQVCDNIRKTTPVRLCDAMEYSLMSPGKRFRPLLVYLAAEACRYETCYVDELFDSAYSAALAIEMIHTYSLIHDDLPAMDDDDLRRGRPTCHKQFDEATAILAADALQALAFEMLLDIKPEKFAIQCLRLLSRGSGCHGMVGGQMDDMVLSKVTTCPMLAEVLHGPFRGLSDAFIAQEKALWRATSRGDEYIPLESMQNRKTGGLIVAALMMGAAIADATPEQIFRIGMYGQSVGLMFQITDDLLDVCATVEQIGKATGKDAEKGKTTWVQLLGVDASRDYVNVLLEHARTEVEKSNFNNPGVLIELLEYVAKRNK